MATISMAMPIAAAAGKNRLQSPICEAFSKPLQLKKLKPVRVAKLRVEASLKEKAVAGITAAVVATSVVVPEVAQAAESLTPSLKNFLLSIAAGAVVFGVIAGAVIGVSNFDPVKRS
ncbi:hypothetical protein CDL12_26075 [Handroanthus impetiginosus]|uniref:Photosystem II n=1 Tax=Handroanthus impetiginosus TaxID=429701 RepID=A0A2G9G7Z6_9LAMI|nr:hypothetical protein CDL12_26075 [Handroanthus impetiginosus]